MITRQCTAKRMNSLSYIIANGKSEAKQSKLCSRYECFIDPRGESYAGRGSNFISPLKVIALNCASSLFLIIYLNITVKDTLTTKNSGVLSCTP